MLENESDAPVDRLNEIIGNLSDTRLLSVADAAIGSLLNVNYLCRTESVNY